MILLAQTLYDPAAAASKSTAALLALTAFDTSKLRHIVEAPASGRLFVRIAGAIEWVAKVPEIMIGVKEGVGTWGRVTPLITFVGSTRATFEARFIISGLNAGTLYSLDAAYAVQVADAGSSIRYGGPDDNAGANAWGGISYEIWAEDNPTPQPDRTVA